MGVSMADAITKPQPVEQRRGAEVAQSVTVVSCSAPFALGSFYQGSRTPMAIPSSRHERSASTRTVMSSISQ